MKRLLLCLGVLSVCLALYSCSNTNFRELSEAQITEILSGVVASEQSVEEAGLRYFLALSAENNNMINAKVLDERLSRGEDLFLLDIRREADYVAGHIRSAKNIWWFDVGSRIAEIPRDRQIIVTCYSGQSAAQVVGVLRVMGYTATSLIGGMNGGWLAAGLPVESAGGQ